MANDKSRTAEILGVFARHNFYSNGLTPAELRTTLEDLGPTYVKIGQIMSSRTDLLPKDYCEELTKLQSQVRPLAASVARQVIEEETGRSIDDIYREFRDKPLGSASIAQAHYGVLRDGTRVVTKVQRPLIADMMRRDFVLLRKIASFVGVLNGGEEQAEGLDFAATIDEFERVTEEELDFRVEAANTRDFREHCIEDSDVVSCPEIVDDLTTERILTMTFVDGYSIAKRDRVEADGYDRMAIADAIVNNYLHQVLDVGTFHADPHQGNIMVSHGVPYWIDFGMVGHISPESVDAIQDVLMALLVRDADALTDAALAIGGTPADLDRDRLTDDVERLMQKYLSSKKVSDIDVGALMVDLSDVMARHHMRMPSEYTMLARSLVTIEGVLADFCPEYDLFGKLTDKMTARMRESFDARAKVEETLQSVMQAGAKTAKLPELALRAANDLARGKTKVKLELTGYEKVLAHVDGLVRNVVLVVLACVIFAGSCTLCTTGMQPQAYGVPVLALGGLVFSIALAIYAVRRL